MLFELNNQNTLHNLNRLYILYLYFTLEIYEKL